jgi:hypothetical protein
MIAAKITHGELFSALTLSIMTSHHDSIAMLRNLLILILFVIGSPAQTEFHLDDWQQLLGEWPLFPRSLTHPPKD